MDLRMPRTLRIDDPGARHHVMKRAANHRPILFDHASCVAFIGVIAELPDRFGMEVDGYALWESPTGAVRPDVPGTPRQGDGRPQEGVSQPVLGVHPHRLVEVRLPPKWAMPPRGPSEQSVIVWTVSKGPGSNRARTPPSMCDHP